jgi:hypothetical protein
MSNTSNPMGLTVWDAETDIFKYTEIASNFTSIANHDHSSGKGSVIPNEGLSSTSGSEAVNTNVIRDNAITSAKIADGAIVNADINTSAAIAASKIATGTANTALFGGTSNSFRAITATDLPTATSSALGAASFSSADFSVSSGAVTIASGGVDASQLVTGVSPALSTTLPITGLFDGYVVNLSDSTTAPTWVWQMRYSSTNSRWEFVGGSWYQVSASGNVTFTGTNASYTNTTSTGTCVLLTIPSFLSTGSATCVFRVESFASGTGGTSATNVAMSFKVGGANSAQANEWTQSAIATNGNFSGFRSSTITGATAGTVIQSQFKNSAATTTISEHSLSIRPTYIDIT